MKKIILSSLLLLATLTLNAAVISTNVTAGGVHLLSTNRASVYTIEVTGNNACLLDFYDNDIVAAPQYGTNYTNASFVSKTSYSTNIAASYIGANGLTNWITNSGLFTLSVTNSAATNVMTPLFSAVVAAGTYAVYNVDALFVRGLAVKTTTNASIVVQYR